MFRRADKEWEARRREREVLRTGNEAVVQQWVTPPPTGEEQAAIERAGEFNRARSAALRARATHKRAERQAQELVNTAVAVLEDAEERYREAALALRRVSAS